VSFLEIIDKAVDYPAYKKNFQNSSKCQNSLERMDEIEKSLVLDDVFISQIEHLNRKIIWLVIAGNCSYDCAEVLPIMHKIAGQSKGKILLKVVSKDTFPELLEMYNTNGVHAIPKAIVLDEGTMDVLNVWGPRPSFLQNLVLRWNENKDMSWEDLETQLRIRYKNDKGKNIVQEFVGILNTISIMKIENK